MGWRTVVSCGRRCRATGMSSNPVTATSPGTSTPRAASAYITPRAVWSFAQAIARGSVVRLVDQPVDHPRAAEREVVAAPLRDRSSELRARPGHLGLERLLPGQVVRAVGMPGQVGRRCRSHGQLTRCRASSRIPARLSPRTFAVVSGRQARQRDDRHLPGKPGELVRLEYPVVQDQAVALAGQREDPLARVMVADVHGPDQQVEPVPLRHHLDAAVDHVGELQALVLVGEEALAGLAPGNAPDGNADDFLEPGAQRAGGAVRREAQLGHRLQTRSLVSSRGLRCPFSTRETDAIETPATRATS